MTELRIQNVTAGDTARWTIDDPARPASEWTGSLFLRGPESRDLVATADGDTHVFELSSADTLSWTAGQYWYQVRFEHDTDGTVVTAYSSSVAVKPSLESVSGEYDGRTDAEKTLAALEACIAKTATSGQRRYRIGNRELDSMSGAELRKWLSFYQEKVRREQAAGKDGDRPFGRTVKVHWRG